MRYREQGSGTADFVGSLSDPGVAWQLAQAAQRQSPGPSSETDWLPPPGVYVDHVSLVQGAIDRVLTDPTKADSQELAARADALHYLTGLACDAGIDQAGQNPQARKAA